MKPGEFDELLKQKFDQNDFEFNAQNWDRLVERMEDKPRKRNMLIWWAMPVAGMAASVALAMGAATLVKYGIPSTSGSVNAMAHAKPVNAKHVQRQPVAQAVTAVAAAEIAPSAETNNAKPAQKEAVNNNDDNSNNGFNARLQAIANITPNAAAPAKKANETVKANDAVAAKRKPITVNEWSMANVTEEDIKKASGLSVTLLGGINYGDRNNGFSAGASIRKMINSKVYIEGDVAFINSANRQLSDYSAYVHDNTPTTSTIPAGRSGAKTTTGTTTEEEELIKKNQTSGHWETRQEDHLYSMQYAQVTPSIGYKIADRISIGAGPDFQQALSDKRPAQSTDNRENQRVAPLFDMGFMGKTEINLAKRLKAAVYYRKGINNVITPMNKYIDRDYLQFQIKCTVFDK